MGQSSTLIVLVSAMIVVGVLFNSNFLLSNETSLRIVWIKPASANGPLKEIRGKEKPTSPTSASGVTHSEVTTSKTPPAPWSPEADRERAYEKIRSSIRSACKREGIRLQSMHAEHRFVAVNREHKLTVCLNAKAASSTLLRLLVNMTRLPEKTKETMLHGDNLHGKFLHSISLGSKIQVNPFIAKNNMFAFTFVRHPFTRIISAYEDKVLNARTAGNRRIISSMRKRFGDSSFRSFVKLVLVDRLRSWQRGAKINPHWTPYFKRCGFCNVKYNAYGKLESYDEDLSYIVKQTHLENLVQLGYKRNVKSSAGQSTDERARKYLSQLEAPLLKKLYEMFKVDFDMFGYSPEKFSK